MQINDLYGRTVLVACVGTASMAQGRVEERWGDAQVGSACGQKGSNAACGCRSPRARVAPELRMEGPAVNTEKDFDDKFQRLLLDEEVADPRVFERVEIFDEFPMYPRLGQLNFYGKIANC
jgi:hypothetical protein